MKKQNYFRENSAVFSTSFVNIYSACLIETGIVISDDELIENIFIEKRERENILIYYCFV